jgi:uncharacterized protein (TIGR03435 family)
MFYRAVVFAFMCIVVAQPQAPAEFEVASVRPNNSGSGSSSSRSRNGRYESTNEAILQLVRSAFEVREYQIIGPEWLKVDRYDIRAKAPDGVPDNQIPSMLQSLLADRFKMKFHRETRELPILALLVAKDGPKLIPATEADFAAPDSGTAPRASLGSTAASGAGGSASEVASGARLSTMHSIGTLASFAGSLSRNVDRPVIDMTGLTGAYNIRLAFKPQSAPPEDQGPSIFTALVEQLGLRLEAREGPVEVIVIDSIEKVREP